MRRSGQALWMRPAGAIVLCRGHSDRAHAKPLHSTSSELCPRPGRRLHRARTLRAAEVTLASGHDWFRVAERDTEIETRFRRVATGLDGTRFYRSGFHDPFFGGVGTTNTRPVNRYEAFSNILVFEGDKPAADPQAYDARSVIATLEPLIVRPEDG